MVGHKITNVINERPMQYKMSLNKRVLTYLICIYGEGRESYPKNKRSQAEKEEGRGLRNPLKTGT